MFHRDERYKQGVYKPLNKKYRGKTYPKYRSSWELKFFRWCDLNPHVVEWNSENVVIPYRMGNTGKLRRYIVDNTLTMKQNGELKKYLVEIKPYSQTQQPKPHGNKKRSTLLYEQITYAKNVSKWTAARAWCKKYGYEFLIITERELFNKRPK